METNISSYSGTLEVLELMKKFFETYPPQEAERIFWEWCFLFSRADFEMLPDERIQEFTDFIERMKEVEEALKKLEKQQGGT